MNEKHFFFSGFSALILALALAISSCADRDALTAADIAANNRGVGLMGSFNYSEAEQVFAALAARHPKHPEIQTNLAVATLNRQQEGDEVTALAILAEVLKIHPDHQRALYCSGLLLLYKGDEEAAFEYFNKVRDDNYALYQRAQILLNRGETEPALALFVEVLERDPYFRSAYYGAFRAYRQTGDLDKARDMLDGFQKLKDNPRSRLFEFKFTRMGALAAVMTLDPPDSIKAAPEVPSGDAFEASQAVEIPAPWTWAGQPIDRMASMTACDVDGDGHIDLFIAAGIVNPSGSDGVRNAVLLGDGQGGFRLDPDHPLALPGQVNAPLWGDYDNDGLTDVYFCRKGENQLWRQTAANSWEDVTASTGTGGGDWDTVAGAIFDADHDGDLDLMLINSDGPNELLNNNRDGSFRPLAKEYGLQGGDTPSRGMIAVDLDGDRDTDIIVINRSPPHEVFINDRLWQYRAGTGLETFESADIVALTSADTDGNGEIELYSMDSSGALWCWRADSRGVWVQPARVYAGPGQALQNAYRARIEVLDIEGNGIPDVLHAGNGGFNALTPGSGSWKNQTITVDAEPVAWTPILQDPAKGFSLAFLNANQLMVLAPGKGRYGFTAVSLTGKEDTGNALRSNASGIGTELAARNGSRWTMATTYPANSAPGQSLQPVAFGMAGSTRLDFIALQWSDGVFQTELEIEAGKSHEIAETQRQLSSCPVVFAWDGEKFAFITDVLGVAGIGFALAPGRYSEPRPFENLVLPKGLLQPKDGRLQIKIGEPMEEATYLDAARLTAYRIPAGWRMALDERMNVAGPEPTGTPLFYRDERLPRAAINDRGQDVLAEVVESDLIAAPIGATDRRFLGRLESDHVLSLEFGEPLDRSSGEPWLLIDGWVEYPYSQTMFAAWQAGADYVAPSLDVRIGTGDWQPFLANFGYPAGMPRAMALPLDKLPAGVTGLRLSTNLEVYWDRIAVIYVEPCPAALRQPLELLDARLGHSGFATRSTGPQMQPGYDYSQRTPFWDTRNMTGFYSEFGDVKPLLAEADDGLAIFGPGEEVHLEFQVPAAGSDCYLVLELEGWCKDMDLFTKDGETLAPLPTSGKESEKRDALNTRYNTRFQSGL